MNADNIIELHDKIKFEEQEVDKLQHERGRVATTGELRELVLKIERKESYIRGLQHAINIVNKP